MTPPFPVQPKIEIVRTPDYREHYANSVQVRLNLMDFLLEFGTASQVVPDTVTLTAFTGIYMSPQQAKALMSVLQHNVQQYENAFGEIHLGPPQGGERVH